MNYFKLMHEIMNVEPISSLKVLSSEIDSVTIRHLLTLSYSSKINGIFISSEGFSALEKNAVIQYVLRGKCWPSIRV